MSGKFELIDAPKADFPIVTMCEWGRGVHIGIL
jgi:hypothetical protein